MFPSAPFSDSKQCMTIDLIIFRCSCDRTSRTKVHFTNFSNVLISQMCKMVNLSMRTIGRTPSFLDRVLLILSICSFPQVIWVATRWIVAGMADLVFVGISARSYIKCNSMSIIRLAPSNSEPSICTFNTSTFPLPASSLGALSYRFIYLIPKTLNVLRCECRKFTIVFSHNLNHLSGLVRPSLETQSLVLGRLHFSTN